MNYETIGKFIQEKRKEKNLTQKELAEKLGVTDKAVSKWERGLGCPDVSILEILSNELGVSILELLKGRIIENEVIKVTEANDYIQETIKYTKNNIQKTINKIITFIILGVSLILLILNIENIMSMNKTYEYNFDNETVIEMKNQLNKLQANIELIESNQGKYTKEEYEEIKKDLSNVKERITNSKLLEYEGYKKMTLKDLYIIDDNILEEISGIRILKTIEKYDDNNEQLIKDNVIAKIYLNINTHEEIEKAYKYKMINMPNNIEIGTTIINNPINLRIKYMKSMISSYIYITDRIIEVGDINE